MLTLSQFRRRPRFSGLPKKEVQRRYRQYVDSMAGGTVPFSTPRSRSVEPLHKQLMLTKSSGSTMNEMIIFNPTLMTGTRLAALSQLWEKIHIKELVYEWHPTCSALTDGTVTFGFDHDPTDPPGLDQIMNIYAMRDHVSGPGRDSMRLRVPVNDTYFTDFNPDQARFSSPGALHFYAATDVTGYLEVIVHGEFLIQQLDTSTAVTSVGSLSFTGGTLADWEYADDTACVDYDVSTRNSLSTSTSLSTSMRYLGQLAQNASSVFPQGSSSTLRRGAYIIFDLAQRWLGIDDTGSGTSVNIGKITLASPDGDSYIGNARTLDGRPIRHTHTPAIMDLMNVISLPK